VVTEFRKAGKTLEAPKCRACELAMEWYRAALKSKEPKIIANYFACAKCAEIAVLDHAFDQEMVTPPEFLSDDLTANERTVWLVRKAE
jgi:hypothetical protein